MTGADLATSADVARLEAKLDKVLAAVAVLEPPQWVSRADAAKALGVSPQTIIALEQRGQIVTRRCGRRVLIDASSLRAPR